MKLLLKLVFLLSIIINLSYCELTNNQNENSKVINNNNNNLSPAISTTNSEKSVKWSLPWFLFSTPRDFQLFTYDVIVSAESIINQNKVNNTNNICIKNIINTVNNSTSKNSNTSNTTTNNNTSNYPTINNLLNLIKDFEAKCNVDVLKKLQLLLQNGVSISSPNEVVNKFQPLINCLATTIESDRTEHAKSLGKCLGSLMIYQN